MDTRGRRHHQDDVDSSPSEDEDEKSAAERMTDVAETHTLDGNGDKRDELATPATSESIEAPVVPMESGMTCDIKNLYSGREDSRGRYQWKETIPKNNKPVENAETAKYALLVRNVEVYNDPRKFLCIHSIVVQSPLLRRLLRKVLKNYPCLNLDSCMMEFTGRFEPIIHRWAKLQENIAKIDCSSEEGRETKNHAELLFSVLKTEFSDVIDNSQTMMSKGVITFKLLWTIFQPSVLVYSRKEGQEIALKLVSINYSGDQNGNEILVLVGEYVDWDGTRFGTNNSVLQIKTFTGTRKISSLAAFPFDYHPQKDDMAKRLLERGAKFEALAGCHYKQYSGIGWRSNQYGGKDKFSIKGRIMVDAGNWHRLNVNQTVFLQPLIQEKPKIRNRDGEDSDGDTEFDGDDMEVDDGGIPLDGHFMDEDNVASRPALTTEQKMICTALVWGYSLKTKMWLNFFTWAISEIVWNEGAFDRLVLPPLQKELFLNFTESQNCYKNSEDAFDDVIDGKGKGMTLLLCGPPGVGKTLTAESVAEEMKVPLYRMAAGDLGRDLLTVETKLRDTLEMCTKWDAILLLDEAGVFLEQRSLRELERSKLVSVFLRVLESSECILFLTTNRVQTFDAAFQSRIHISLDYPKLSVASRLTVWSNFLASLKHSITDIEVGKLSIMDLNGRQIKNILKTAQLLARRQSQPFDYDHIRKVVDGTQHLHNSSQLTERERTAIYC